MAAAHDMLEAKESPELTIDLNQGRDEQVSIVIVHHNQPEYLNICLQSIQLCSHMNNYEVIVVDNNSQDSDTQEYLKAIEEEGIKVIRNSENVYWSPACNQGVKLADKNSSYYLFMHCDTVVLNNAWLDILVNISVSKGSGLVGTQLGEYYVQKQKVQFVRDWCLLISKDCWDQIGPWPEELPLVGGSFIMTLRAQFCGFKPQATANPIVHHYAAFGIDPSEYERMAEDAMSKIPQMMQEAQTMV